MERVRSNGPLIAAVVAASVWFVLARNSPTNTYHFAPLVVAAVAPIGERLRGEDPLGRARATYLGGVGLGFALVVGAVLWASDSLRGPDLLGGDASVPETALFALIGAAAGSWWAQR